MAARMEEKSDSSDPAGEFPADTCQGCGSLDVQHRSYSHIDDQQGGKLVLLCDGCHRKRFDP
jgi:hypothetical protein